MYSAKRFDRVRLDITGWRSRNLLEAVQNALKSVVPADIKIPVDQEQSNGQ